MNSYLALSKQSLLAHKKRTRLSMLSIALSVALVVGIFSMMDVFLRFEKQQVIHDFGNYHILIKDPTGPETAGVSNRIDVENAGIWTDFGGGDIGESRCSIIALDENFAPNMGMALTEGSYPKAADELMLERWGADKLGVRVGDSVTLTFEDGASRSFAVTGIISDYASTKASDELGVIISVKAAENISPKRARYLLVEFKDRADIPKAEAELKEALKIPESRIGRNERLLAVIGQSGHSAAIGFYQVGTILSAIVLTAGIVMIYNTFNISVVERIRAFGLLRCVGASKSQIRRIVRQEGFLLLRWALLPGILLGMAATLFCSALLKYFNGYIFAGIPLFTLSPAGILAGTAVGGLTVFFATLLPAKKASGVSPVNALTGNSEIRLRKARARGRLTRALPAETAMGIENAFARKKTLLLMSASIALSIVMFLGFGVFVNFLYSNMKTSKPYTPDVSLTADGRLPEELSGQLSQLSGVKNVFGRMFSHVDAAFDASRLTEYYRQTAGGVTVNADGSFIPPEKSWLISYDKAQLRWAKPELLEGTLSEEALNSGDGIVAVYYNIRQGISAVTAELHVGDLVTLGTVSGPRTFKVMAVVRTVPFSDSELNLATFIATEQVFSRITGEHAYKIIDVQLEKRSSEETISQIKRLLGQDVGFFDLRQKNREITQTFLTMAVFVYGFVAVIALISILNIVNTMNTSVASKMKYLGVLRAVGMSGRQLGKMVAAEALVYCATGCVAGCVLGVRLQLLLIDDFLTAVKINWSFPYIQIVSIFAAAILITLLSVAGPLKKVRAQGISQTIGTLQ
ncbi:MAG TPA: FtsX-like permease family protein [Terriglobales bacterium]|nr:FtsX-like permease family protein [Terriglobales bacterium]